MVVVPHHLRLCSSLSRPDRRFAKLGCSWPCLQCLHHDRIAALTSFVVKTIEISFAPNNICLLLFCLSFSPFGLRSLFCLQFVDTDLGFMQTFFCHLDDNRCEPSPTSKGSRGFQPLPPTCLLFNTLQLAVGLGDTIVANGDHSLAKRLSGREVV